MLEPKEEEQPWDCEGRPPGNHSASQEVFRQRFRQLCYQETPGPREALSQLRVLCCEWLRPERHSKEQIVELLVLEQFLSILPKELQARVQEHQPENGEDMVIVLEDLQLERGEAGRQVDPEQTKKQNIAVEKTAPLTAVQEQQVQPEWEAPKPEREKGEETRIENGELAIVTDSSGTIESSGKIPKPTEAHDEDCDLERQQAKTQEKTDCKCSECGEAFMRHSDLTEHERAHTRERPSASELCQSSSVTGHQEILSGKKGHQCPECGKVFQRSSHLVRHQKIHLGEKPYQCKECGNVFSQNAGLLEHLRIHTGEKPYLCDKCGRGFNRVDNLRSHVKTVHQGKAGIKILEPEEGGEVSVVTVDDMVTLATEALAATAVTQLTVVPVGAAVTADETEVLKAEISKAVKQVQEEDPNTHILYACDSCGDKFLDANSLAQHVRIHTAQALVMFQTDADFYQQYGPGGAWPAGPVLQAGELVFRPRDGAEGQPALADTHPTAPECPPPAE